MFLSSALRRSLANRSLPSFVQSSSLPATRAAASPLRPFSLSAKLAEHQEKSDSILVDQSKPHLETTETPSQVADDVIVQPPEDASAIPLSTDQESVPWYLQVDPPTPHQEHPFAERQRLPELPQSSPAILRPILEHVSVELGLDHLSLIDLRELDPPPALGANLIMVIGTARSEKHLHVSADRLCRWLRTEHRLSPYADGLLGRNELKLKLKRKAKKTRLLSAVGAKETASQEIDDGIRTGWVCVNVGQVQGGALKQPEHAHDFVGFGGQSSGSRIVVQMMTDEKRGQIDLETLWNGILRRSIKAQTDQSQQVDDAEKRVRSGMLLEESTESPGKYRYRPHAAEYPSGQQARALHSSAKTSTQQGAHIPTSLQTNTSSDLSKSAVILNHMVDQINAMSPTDARDALGHDSSDQESTPFLRAFYAAMPRFPATMHWHMHIALRCHAIRLGHDGYLSTCLVKDLDSMRLACLVPGEDTYLLVLETSMLPYLGEVSTKHKPIARTILCQALAILDRMFEDGYNPVSNSVCQILYRATSTASVISEDASTTAFSQSTSHERPFAPNQLVSALSIYALSAAAYTSAWSKFWDVWHSYPRRMSPRSSDMYVTMFDKVAERNSQKDAMDALRRCVPEMLREQPAVRLEGQVADAILRCLHIAEPRAEKLAREGNRGEWASLWLRCAKALNMT